MAIERKKASTSKACWPLSTSEGKKRKAEKGKKERIEGKNFSDSYSMNTTFFENEQ